MQFLDVNGVRIIKEYIDGKFVTTSNLTTLLANKENTLTEMTSQILQNLWNEATEV